MKSIKNTSAFIPVFLLLVRDIIIFPLNQKNNGVNSSLPIGKRRNLWYNEEVTNEPLA